MGRRFAGAFSRPGQLWSTLLQTVVYPVANRSIFSLVRRCYTWPHRTGDQYSLFYVGHPSGFRPLALPEPADGTAGNGSGVGDRTTDIPAGCDRGDRGCRRRFFWRPSAIEVLAVSPAGAQNCVKVTNFCERVRGRYQRGRRIGGATRLAGCGPGDRRCRGRFLEGAGLQLRFRSWRGRSDSGTGGALGAIDVGSGGSAAYLVGRPGLDALRGDLRLASGCGPGPDVRPVVFAGARVQLQVLVLEVDRRGERFCRRSTRPLCPIQAKMAPIGPKTAKSRKKSGAGEIRPHRKRSKRRFRSFRYCKTSRFRPCGWRRWRPQEAGPQARHSSRSQRSSCLSVYEGSGMGMGWCVSRGALKCPWLCDFRSLTKA